MVIFIYTTLLKGFAMKKIDVLLAVGFIAIFFSGCATVSEKARPVESPVSEAQQLKAQKQFQVPIVRRYKRKLAIGRFTNETNYGRALMTDDQYDLIGKQASDMLASKLIKSDMFLVFERPDIKKIQNEQKFSDDSKLIGVDALIVGSVTEFGRSVGGKVGFLSSTKVQVAKAKVDVRLIDVKTGLAFFSAIGAGEASTESGEIAGYGSQADYDATLNDRAISAAISDVIDKLVSSLEERKWKTDVLEIQGQNIYISGGIKQGLKIGDILQVMEPGEIIKSRQTGFDINLPSKNLATVKVVSFFGDTENNEGSICKITSGEIEKYQVNKLYVEEVTNESK